VIACLLLVRIAGLLVVCFLATGQQAFAVSPVVNSVTTTDNGVTIAGTYKRVVTTVTVGASRSLAQHR
jgi:hypothetical protein